MKKREKMDWRDASTHGAAAALLEIGDGGHQSWPPGFVVQAKHVKRRAFTVPRSGSSTCLLFFISHLPLGCLLACLLPILTLNRPQQKSYD